jgi:hypothetical protein
MKQNNDINGSNEGILFGTQQTNKLSLDELKELYLGEWHNSIDDLQEVYKFAPERKAKTFLLDFLKKETSENEFKKLQKQTIPEIVKFIKDEFDKFDIEEFFKICIPTKLKEWFVKFYFPKRYDSKIKDTTLQKLELQLLSNEIIPDHNELKERIDVLKNRLAKRITQRPRLFINKQAYQRWQAYTRKMQKQIDKLESLLRIESLTKNFSEDKFGMNTSISEVLSGLGALVYHNSPYLLKKADGSFIDPITKEKLGFDHRFMGKGEGSQVHGWGSYFSVNDLRKYGKPSSVSLADSTLNDYPTSDVLRNGLWHIEWKYFLSKGFANTKALRYYIETYTADKDKRRFDKERKKILDYIDRGIIVFGSNISHNYVVEIPDNDGFNYLEENEPIKSKQLSKIVALLNKKDKKTGDYFRTLKGSLGANIYYELSLICNTPEMASKFLKKCGIIGIHYFGKIDGEGYVIFDENDAKIVKHELFGLGSLISEPTKQTFYENLYRQLESIVKDDSFEKNGIRKFILSHIPEDYKNDDIEGIVEVFYQRLRALKCGENNELSGLGDIELDTTTYDSKHINNLAPNKNIPESIIAELNYDGLTVENIEKLQDNGFPVCKYKTQITVHGNCPELKSNYVDGYSCLVKNQNNSLGVKWNGIDTKKKSRLIHLAFDVSTIFSNKEHKIIKSGDDYYINNRWHRYWNSTTSYLWQYVTITNRGKRYSYQFTQEDKDNIKKIAEKLSEKLKGLFFGYIEVKYPAIKIVILGIYEKNIDKFCRVLFDYTQTEIKEMHDEYEELKKEKQQLKELQRKKVEKERDEYFEEWKKQNPMPENFVPISRYPVKGDIIAEYWGKYTGVSMAKDGGYYFDKESFKPEIVFQKFYNSFGKLCYRRCDKDGNFTERHGDEFKGEYPKDWYLKTNTAIEKPQPTTETTSSISNDIEEDLKEIRSVIIQNENFNNEIRFDCYSPKIAISLFRPKYFPSENFRQDIEIAIIQFNVGSTSNNVDRNNSFLKKCTQIAKQYANIASFDTKLDYFPYSVRIKTRFKKECLFSEIADIFVSCIKEFYRGNKNSILTIDDNNIDYKHNNKTSSTTVSNVTLQIVDYSEKGVVLTGDTKPIKDEIKALGGKFGMRFDTSKVPSGVGWIFPKTKLAEVEKLVAKYSTKGGNIETDKELQMLELQLVSDSGLGCLKLDTLSGLTPINKLKRINQ